MSDKLFNRSASLFLTLALAFGILAAFTMQSEAASKWQFGPYSCYAGQSDVSVWVGYTNSKNEYVQGDVVSAAIVSTYPNTAGATVRKRGDGDWVVNVVKKGKFKLQVTFKDSKGKTYTKSKKVTVNKYPNFIKKLKVNGKTVRITKSKRYSCTQKCTGDSAKIKITPKKGWEIYDVFAYKSVDEYHSPKFADIKKSNIKKGKAFKFQKKYSSMSVNVNLYNEELGQYIQYVIYLTRN